MQSLHCSLGPLSSILSFPFPIIRQSQTYSFIDMCNKALNEFSGIVSQIHKSAAMIDEVVSNIEHTVLVQEHDFRASSANGHIKPMEVLEFFDMVEVKRMSRLESLVSKSKSLQSPLIKVEELVAGTNTGNSPVLARYYHYWEKKMYNAIAKMTISSLASFIVLLQVSSFLFHVAHIHTSIPLIPGRFNSPVPLMEKNRASMSARYAKFPSP